MKPVLKCLDERSINSRRFALMPVYEMYRVSPSDVNENKSISQPSVVENIVDGHYNFIGLNHRLETV